MQSQTTATTLTGRKTTSIEELYLNCFPVVARFVSQHQGTYPDAKDIFQDALIIYMERCERPDVEDVDHPQRYVLGIAKHLWIHKHKEKARYIGLDSFEASLSIPPDFYPEVKEDRLLAFLELTGEKCLALLRDFYYRRMTMKEIAVKNKYGGEHSATVQKYKCIEKIRETIKNKALTYEDFFE
jgi:RNA polymerase sigma factor (sigma-70 family)